mmetsp:Transcript_16911/g.32080  ORF Transcript_16911/g.32080 Transcript_16911/m.32080 type:complete len:200 (-) Transcript_16911:1030-1629(-)
MTKLARLNSGGWQARVQDVSSISFLQCVTTPAIRSQISPRMTIVQFSLGFKTAGFALATFRSHRRLPTRPQEGKAREKTPTSIHTCSNWVTTTLKMKTTKKMKTLRQTQRVQRPTSTRRNRKAPRMRKTLGGVRRRRKPRQCKKWRMMRTTTVTKKMQGRRRRRNRVQVQKLLLQRKKLKDPRMLSLLTHASLARCARS